MAVLGSIQAELEAAGVRGWKRDLAESLATGMDASPNASTAKELQALMTELLGAGAEVKADVSDDLAAQRERRRAASS